MFPYFFLVNLTFNELLQSQFLFRIIKILSRLVIAAIQWMKQIIVKKKKVKPIENGGNVKEKVEIIQKKFNCFDFCWTQTKFGFIIAFLIVCDQSEIFDDHPK